MKRFYTFLLAAMATTLCTTAQSTETTYEAVDLGLSVKWATCNVGATSPEKYGNYYAWGETESKSDYSWDTYKYGSAQNALTKYCDNSSYGKDGFTDELTTLEAADDAATANWGEEWRMPTEKEWEELYKNCTYEWTTNYNETGVKGYIFKSKTNSNSIFLPAAGVYTIGGLNSAGSNCNYWSRSLYTGYPIYANSADFRWGNSESITSCFRYCGMSVRPVQDVYAVNIAATTNGTVEPDKTKAAKGETITLTVTPADDYELDVLTVKDAEGKEITVTDNKFTMPASDVTISATFKAKTATAIENAKMVEFYAENGTIYGAEGMQIFTITGQNVTEMNGSLNGVYIVKFSDKAQKIVVSSK